jgi:hypothetical protein
MRRIILMTVFLALAPHAYAQSNSGTTMGGMSAPGAPGTMGGMHNSGHAGTMSTGPMSGQAENCGTPDEPKPCPPMPRHPLPYYPANRP